MDRGDVPVLPLQRSVNVSSACSKRNRVRCREAGRKKNEVLRVRRPFLRTVANVRKTRTRAVATRHPHAVSEIGEAGEKRDDRKRRPAAHAYSASATAARYNVRYVRNMQPAF